MAINKINSKSIEDLQISADDLANGTVTSAKLSYPLTTFSSTGIDDNATSTAITIDSSEKVGIGTSSPDDTLHVNSGGQNDVAKFESTDTTASLILVDSATTTDGNRIQTIGDTMNFQTAGSEAMRINSSGHLGIGSTSPDSRLEVLDSSATGIISRSTSTQATDTNKALRVRNNSDTNTFAVSYKGSVFLGSGTGIYFDGSTSGSNSLDDYEEGTFTPDVYHSSSNNSTWTNVNGEYTRIGNTVICQIRVDVGNSGTAGSVLTIGGLPFTVDQAQSNMSIGTWGSNPSQQVGNVHGFNPPRLYKGGGSIDTQMTFITINLAYKTTQ